MKLFEKDPGTPSKNPTASVWLDENPLKNYKYSERLLPYSDIVIIGSGFSGASAAYHLLADERTRLPKISTDPSNHSNGKSVTMLEAREACSGATGRNGGHLIPANYRDFIDDTKATGSAENVAATRIFEQIGAAEVADFITKNKVDCEFRFDGNLEIYTSEEDFKSALENLKVARSWGIGGQQIYTAQELKTLFGNTKAVGGIKIPGGQVFPAKLIWFLLQKSIDNGLRLYTHYPVSRVVEATATERSQVLGQTEQHDFQGKLWKVIAENGEHIFANKVVHATNAYASHILPDYRSHIFPVRAQVLSPAPEQCANKLFPFGLSLRHGLEYAIQRDYPNGRLIFGGRRTSSPTFEVDNADDSAIHPNLCRDLRKDLNQPEFGSIGLNPECYYGVREWTGIMGFSDDLFPYIGEVVTRSGETLQGQYISAGFTGHGMPKCFRCGREIARLLTESFLTPQDKAAKMSSSSQAKSYENKTAKVMALSPIFDQNAPNKVSSSIWTKIGITDADTWDYPLYNAMTVTPERLRTVKTESWAYRSLIPTKSKL